MKVTLRDKPSGGILDAVIERLRCMMDDRNNWFITFYIHLKNNKQQILWKHFLNHLSSYYI